MFAHVFQVLFVGAGHIEVFGHGDPIGWVGGVSNCIHGHWRQQGQCEFVQLADSLELWAQAGRAALGIKVDHFAIIEKKFSLDGRQLAFLK
jgi:hypothetical protein